MCSAVRMQIPISFARKCLNGGDVVSMCLVMRSQEDTCHAETCVNGDVLVFMVWLLLVCARSRSTSARESINQ